MKLIIRSIDEVGSDLVVLQDVEIRGKDVRTRIRHIAEGALCVLSSTGILGEDPETEAWAITTIVLDYPLYAAEIGRRANPGTFIMAIHEITDLYYSILIQSQKQPEALGSRLRETRGQGPTPPHPTRREGEEPLPNQRLGEPFERTSPCPAIRPHRFRGDQAGWRPRPPRPCGCARRVDLVAEYLAVAHASGTRGSTDGLDALVGPFGVDTTPRTDLGEHRHRRRAATHVVRVAHLRSATHDLRNGDSTDIDVEEGLLDVLKRLLANDCLDFEHVSTSKRTSADVTSRPDR